MICTNIKCRKKIEKIDDIKTIVYRAYTTCENYLDKGFLRCSYDEFDYCERVEYRCKRCDNILPFITEDDIIKMLKNKNPTPKSKNDHNRYR